MSSPSHDRRAASRPYKSRVVALLAAARSTPAVWALTAITIVGALLRIYLLHQYRPAFLGFPDSVVYVVDAHQGLFADPLRVSGFALFLRVLHAVSPHLILVTIVQHGLGLASGLLLFDAVRRSGAPIGLGLVPAAVVMLGGAQILLEHALLTDSLFIFLVDLSLWFVVRTWTGRPWWALGIGLSMGFATIVRTVGLELLPFVLLSLLLVPAGLIPGRPLSGRVPRIAAFEKARSRRPGLTWRLIALTMALVGSLLVIVPFLSAHKHDTGQGGFASASYFDAYGRVAPWADCTKFRPPPGTTKLCPQQPVSQRQGTEAWEFLGSSPAVAAYGSPEWFGPPPQKDENAQLRSFAIAAVKGQPLTYLRYVGRDLIRVFDPGFSTSPYKSIGNAGYGLTPDALQSYYFDTSNIGNIEAIINSYYRSPGLLTRNVDLLKAWDRHTRIQGPVMLILLILALLAAVLARGAPQRLAILLGVVAAVLVVAPVLVLDYDWRFMIPAFGPLSGAAAIGAYEVWLRRAVLLRLRRSRG